MMADETPQTDKQAAATAAATADARNAANVRVERHDGKVRVSVCAGTACIFAGGLAVHDAFVEEVASAGLQDKVEVSIIGCHGLCSEGPVTVLSDDTFYPHLKPDHVKTVVAEHLVGGAPVEKYFYKNPQTKERIRDFHDIDFYKQQVRIALRDVGVINPESMDEYIARGGYEAARQVLSQRTPSRSSTRSRRRACAAAAAPASLPAPSGSSRASRRAISST